MPSECDVVVVGAGISGSALAATLASSGFGVTLLEAQERYRDRVRGEAMPGWGVREVRRLRLEEVLLGAGGMYTERLVGYDEVLIPEDAEARSRPYSNLLPDVPGNLNVGHPEACQALALHAAEAGAAVVTGVSAVQVQSADRPSVAWTDRHGRHEMKCRMVVGADGRSSVVRRQIGVLLQERPALTYGAGLLVRTSIDLDNRDAIGTAGDAMFFALPRAHGLTRLYLLVDIRRQPEFTGPKRQTRFLEMFPTSCYPASTDLAQGAVVGPCGGAPMTDSWTAGPPVRPGAILVGDAAGWSDPIIGQGLSVALRDARLVGDIMTDSDDWSPDTFASYVEERVERMRRLAMIARIATAIRCTFTTEGRARRERWFEAFATEAMIRYQSVAAWRGPESAPPEAFTDEAVDFTLRL